jgi:hypothetical protein
MKYIFLLLYLPFTFSTFSQQDAINMVIIGDSHTKGYFGERLHQRIHSTGMFNIFSIGLGGAGTQNYLYTLYNNCCGYKVRLTCAEDIVDSKGKLPFIENEDKGSGSMVLKKWNGKFKNILQWWQPQLVVVALGSNYVNSHSAFISTIYEITPAVPIVWIGPYRRKNSSLRYQAIQKVIKEFPDIQLIRSDDLVGNDSITSVHFTKKMAERWADSVYTRMRPLLLKHFEKD